MLTLVPCKNVLNLTCSDYVCILEGLKYIKHLFSSTYCDSSRGSFFHDIPNGLCNFMVLITDIFRVKLSVKYSFCWKPCLLKFLPAIHILIWICIFLAYKPKNFALNCKALLDAYTDHHTN